MRIALSPLLIDFGANKIDSQKLNIINSLYMLRANLNYFLTIENLKYKNSGLCLLQNLSIIKFQEKNFFN